MFTIYGHNQVTLPFSFTFTIDYETRIHLNILIHELISRLRRQSLILQT